MQFTQLLAKNFYQQQQRKMNRKPLKFIERGEDMTFPHEAETTDVTVLELVL